MKWHAWRARRAGRPRVKRGRLFAIVAALLVLGGISFVFGMFMALASDLPALEDEQRFNDASNSVLLDDQGHTLAVLSQHNQILLRASQIPRIVKDAVISIEDKRFYTNEGIDLRSMLRAAVHDVFGGGGLQGASTIEEQFVKNALAAQSHRTIFEKLKEAALAFHLDHRWSKEKILMEYLNTIYFGNGAYGVEAAARTYFAHVAPHIGCGTLKRLCVSELSPAEAAMLAGIIQSPTDYNPITHPIACRERRNLVLAQMLAQHYIDSHVYQESISAPLPPPQDIEPPREQLAEGVDAGYFTSWVSQQVIAKYGATRAFDGGLRIETTLNLPLQRAAERAVSTYMSNPAGPTAALVAIENATGDVRAMVGGRNYETHPFNIATEGERQPGSAFKAFDLAAALMDGISPSSVWPSKMKVFRNPKTGEVFVVHNDEGAYTGTNTLTGATTVSDNSIYAEVGIKVGTARIAAIAHRMGITTPISTNYAMTIGGLSTGVTPLDMAHAYETIAHGGQRVSGTLAAAPGAPVAIQEVSDRSRALPNGRHREVNRPIFRRVLPASIAATETSMLQTVIEHGTGVNAAIGQFAAGKTGTTNNYVDAWFVGFDHKYTVAVWVGYPESAKPMPTQYNGTPVYGGTYPALIWKAFMLAALQSEGQNVQIPSPGTEAASQAVVSGASEAQSSAATNAAPRGERKAQGGASGSAGSEGQREATPAHEGGQAGQSTPGATQQTPKAPAGQSAPAGEGTPSPSSGIKARAREPSQGEGAPPAEHSTPPAAPEASAGPSQATGGASAP